MSNERKHMIEFNSTYMEYQRNKIREQQRAVRRCYIIYAVLCLFVAFLVFNTLNQIGDNASLKARNQELQQIILEKNEVIKQQTEVINEQKAMLDKYDESFYSKLKEAIYDLSGSTIDRATAVIYYEATNQGEKGMQLVADTIWNRKNSEQFSADTIKEVLKYPKQFNAITKINRLTEENKNSEQYLMAQQIVWDKVLKNKTASNEVLFYMNPKLSADSSRGWFRTKQLLFKYKQHEFYK